MNEHKSLYTEIIKINTSLIKRSVENKMTS